MISQTQVQIASKLGEIILQTRLDVKKPLFAHFRDFLAPYKSPKQQYPAITIPQFLKQLLPKDLYSLRPKIMSKLHIDKSTHSIHLQIYFTLIERRSGSKVQAECWNVELTRKSQIVKQCLPLLVQFFLEAILLLNKLPLFSIYQKDRDIRTRYMLDYKILFENTAHASIVEVKAKDFVYRQNNAFRIKAKISYVPSLQFLREENEGMEGWKQRKESVATSDYGNDRKVSVYTFYDADLDCHFLSSDQESFLKKGITSSVEIKVEMDSQQCSEQFELLIADEDEDFFNDNRELLDYLAKGQKGYLDK